MTAQEELTMLETEYASRNGVDTYSITANGSSRMFQKWPMDKLIQRIDTLRAAVARATNGNTFVANFRDPE